jgi:AcrR family transcriptional regulator
MTKSKNTKQHILSAALKEFANHGFAGARMEKIARRANINKAMLFYYYSSKRLLYQAAIKQSFSKLLPYMAKIFTPLLTPKRFLEMVPKLHFQFLRKNRDLVKILSFDMLHDHQNVGSIIKETLDELPVTGVQLLQQLVNKWYKKGLITEPDPMNFITNIISLTIFSLIAGPVLQSAFREKPLDEEAYFQHRTKSITNLLKRGMLS